MTTLNNILTVILSSSSFFVTFSLLLMPSVLLNSYAVLQEHQANGSMNQMSSIYGCESIAGSDYLHCDLFKNEFEGNSTSYNSTKIIDITREPFYVNGVNGKAVEFIDRYREYVEIPETNLYNMSEFSVLFWVRETKNSEQASPYAHVISQVNNNLNNGWYFEHTPNNQSIRFIVTDPSNELIKSNGVTISNSSFTNIAATFDGSQIAVYKNGSLFQNIDYNGNYSSALNLPIYVGSASYCNSCMRFTGIIDDIKLFNRTMSDDEIKQLYLDMQTNRSTNNYNNNSSTNSDLVGHWSFDATLEDLSIYKNNAKMFTLFSSMATTPDDRIFISEKNTGKIKIMKDGKLIQKPFAVINDSYVGWEQGLLGLAIDPEFTDNHFIYLYYTSVSADGNFPVNKVVRFTEKNNMAVNSTVLLDNIPASNGYHAGGALAIGPDDKLYITVGDATVHIYAQSSDVFVGKILRINTDGTIPSDNPFPNSPVYTLGHRNMFGIAFDDKDKIGIVTENGDVRYDEINLIKKGGNYGFPTMQIPNVSPELSNSTLDLKPLRSYWETPAPTQAIYYTGDKFPSLKDNFLFGTYTGDIYAIHIDNVSKMIDFEQHLQLNNYPFEAATGITQTSDGNIYFGTNSVRKLDSIIRGEEPYQILFPVTINRSENVIIDGIYPQINASVIIDLHSTSNNFETNSSQYIKLKMPKSLIYEVENVTYNLTSQDQTQTQTQTQNQNQNQTQNQNQNQTQ
ncbi:MAG TPA: PQQ-dependent sugar dehydrogenase, partial [Candidatus Nitrosocosmicus sp.]|nr:PQQ-dependent sugar dehydrogenase [Candidatus Nitrosocosmicus sp.]